MIMQSLKRLTMKEDYTYKKEKKMKAITEKDLQQFQQSFENKPVQKALKRVLMQSELSKIFMKQEQAQQNQYKFSHEIKTLPSLSISHQHATGRCWIFAGLNVMKYELARKYDLKTFEFSHNYTAFWDKFEKINYFIQVMDDFLEADQDDRKFQHILKMGIQDGGQWDMFVSLIEKYGVVPKEVMPETTSSNSTRYMNQIINVKLRQYVANARKLTKNNQSGAIEALKKQTLDELYTLLVLNFGTPPTTFNFEYFKKEDNEYQVIKDLTPLTFYQNHVGVNLSDYVSIINAPTQDKPFLHTFQVEYLGNVIGGRDIKYLNLEMEDLKALVRKQIEDNEVVWFGSDVARYGNRETGIWDDEQFDDEALLGMSLYMSKEDQLDYSQSAMNHAMVFTAIHLENNETKRWKIENSWGEQSGNKGFYMCSDTWFDRFVYQAVIHHKHLSKEQKAAWKKDPIILKPWDPMGSLA